MISEFDRAAATFNQRRGLPSGVAEAIRAAVCKAAGIGPQARILDLGAGAGRLGEAFVAAGDRYIGVDLSLAMLREFANQSPRAKLAQADGAQLPFQDANFDVVLLAHVLSGAPRWRGLVADARRVLRPGGSLIVGQTAGPEAGIDAQMKRRLGAILANMNIDQHGPEKNRGAALSMLVSEARRNRAVTAASWDRDSAPRDFLERRSTAHRFSALPVAVQNAALRQLSNWAADTFGSLEVTQRESCRFELQIFEF